MEPIENYSIDKELRLNERIIWKGKPAEGIKLRGSDAFLIPFSLLWGGFAIFWEITAVTQIPKDQAVGFIFPLFGIPFVLVGLYFIFGRFLFDAKTREKTEYAITNQRVIIKSGIFSRKVKTINLTALPETSFTEKSDGSGTITFGESSSPWSMMRGFYWPGMPNMQSPAFEMIGNVRSVYELIQKEQRQEA
jgi:hypothetical protein